MTDPLLPLMPKATAVWLVDNTTLTFRQIADFCGMHELEISGIADAEVAVGIKGLDPIQNNQLTGDEIKRCEADPIARLKLRKRTLAPPPKKKAPRYVPVSKRQDRPSAIAWLVRYHPEIETTQIAKLVGSTKPTIEAIRNRTHWNSANIQPVDPVALGLCSQVDLDAIVAKAADKKAKRLEALGGPAEVEALVSTEESLAVPEDVSPAFADLGVSDQDSEGLREPVLDPDALFNLPKVGPEGQ
ncbi:MAG: cell cycle transcriptional regulator TrcR [Pseudomonadota bacterium]